jgi:hypothetical protein
MQHRGRFTSTLKQKKTTIRQKHDDNEQKHTLLCFNVSSTIQIDVIPAGKLQGASSTALLQERRRRQVTALALFQDGRTRTRIAARTGARNLKTEISSSAATQSVLGSSVPGTILAFSS